MSSPPSLLIRPRQLFDGIHPEPLLRPAVWVREGRIAGIRPAAEATEWERAAERVLDAPDATLLPGLIDTHVHLTFSAGPSHEAVRATLAAESDEQLALRALGNAWAHLAGGVVGMRDTGGRGFVVLAVRDAIESGIVPGPRLAAAGPAITTPRGHLFYLGCTAVTAEEVRQAARRILDRGADFVKICATGGVMTAESDPLAVQYPEEALRAAVEEAEARGTLVAAHVLAAEGIRRCVRAGVRSIEHCLWQEAAGEFRFDPEVAAEMVRRRIVAGITFAGISQIRYLEAIGAAPPSDYGRWQAAFAQRYPSERRMIDAGVPYVIHSDAGVRETPFGAFWRCPAAAVFELGLRPWEALRAVTHRAAALLGWDDLGRIAVGQRADLLLVEGDPLETIEHLARVRCVLLGGERVVDDGRLVFSRAA